MALILVQLWIKLSELDRIVMYPNIKERILSYEKRQENIEIIEEYNLN